MSANPAAHPLPASVNIALLVPVVAIALSIALFFDAWSAMAAVWQANDTYAHGWLVVPIALWLIWRQRDLLAAIPLRPQPLALLGVLGCGALWLAGELASVNAAIQFAAVGMIPFMVMLVAGLPFVLAIAFPLAFLLFAVPFGEFLVPMMMDHTADATIWALRATGIPVYREGLYFTLPSGRWSVVEACSGLRYLIASVVLGTLFAHLMFRSRVRKALFIGASIVVPVVANWARAYMIVMIGHLSGMKLAVGVDHLIYGWLFFGIVIFLLFWVGARFRDDLDPSHDGTRRALPGAAPLPAAQAHRGAARAFSGRRPFAAVPLATVVVGLLAIVALQPLAHLLRDRTVPQALPTDATARFSSFVASDRPLGFRPGYDGARTELLGVVDSAGRPVGVHLAYYSRQHETVEMIGHPHALVQASDEQWRLTQAGRRDLILNGKPVPVSRVLIRGRDDRLLLAYHWFTIDGRPVAGNARAKLLTAANLLQGHGDHSVSTAVWVEVDRDLPQADAALAMEAARLANAAAGLTSRPPQLAPVRQ